MADEMDSPTGYWMAQIVDGSLVERSVVATADLMAGVMAVW